MPLLATGVNFLASPFARSPSALSGWPAKVGAELTDYGPADSRSAFWRTWPTPHDATPTPKQPTARTSDRLDDAYHCLHVTYGRPKPPRPGPAPLAQIGTLR
jgi:hypothetical protein